VLEQNEPERNWVRHMIATGYARLYGPLAVVSVVIAFQPILGGDYGTLWEMAGRRGGGPAIVGVLLMGGLIWFSRPGQQSPARSRRRASVRP
jgi:hypothetical protein